MSRVRPCVMGVMQKPWPPVGVPAPLLAPCSVHNSQLPLELCTSAFPWRSACVQQLTPALPASSPDKPAALPTPCPTPCAEKELSTTRAQLQSLSGERDGLRDDLRAVREAKRQADAALEAATEKSAALDRELSFYQQQAAKVMADRDKAAWEAEELRGANLSLDTRLREASSRAETEAAQRRQLESQVGFLKTRLAEVEAKAAAAERQLQVRCAGWSGSRTVAD